MIYIADPNLPCQPCGALPLSLTVTPKKKSQRKPNSQAADASPQRGPRDGLVVGERLPARQPTTRESAAQVKHPDVKTALLHLTELAAAAEGNGMALPDQLDTSDEDQKVLDKVTGILLKHRERQRQRQRDAICDSLVDWLAKLYTSFGQTGDAPAYRSAVREMFQLAPVRPTEDELKQLILPLDGGSDADGNALSIKGLGGPVDAAKSAVGKTVGRGSSTLATVRAKGFSLAAARLAFGRWVPPGAAETYFRKACRVQAAALTRAEPPTLGELKFPSEAVGQHIDARNVWDSWQVHRTTTTVHVELGDDAHELFKRGRAEFVQHAESLTEVLTGSASLLADVPEDAEAMLGRQDWSPRLRIAILGAVKCAESGVLTTAGRRLLRDAARDESIEAGRVLHLDLLGPDPWPDSQSRSTNDSSQGECAV